MPGSVGFRRRSGAARRLKKWVKYYICGDLEVSKPEPSMNMMNGHGFLQLKSNNEAPQVPYRIRAGRPLAPQFAFRHVSAGSIVLSATFLCPSVASRKGVNQAYSNIVAVTN